MSIDQVVYLEKFVESTVTMPSELTRLLNMIRELDHKTEQMNAVVEERYKKILAMPTGKAHMAEVAAETKLLKEEQALLIQWAEEKVQLAGTGYEILETYAHNLEGDIGNLAQYLTETGQLVDDYMGDEYGMSVDPNMYDSAPPKRSASRQLGYTSSMDGFESVPPLETKPPPMTRKTQIPLTISRQPSGYGQAETTPVVADVPDTSKRRRSGSDTRRRSASAAVHATTAVVAALYDDDDYVEIKNDPAANMAMLAPIPLEPFIPGLKESAKKPQAARRRLTDADINPSLVGKIAEVFWVSDKPEESLWYLVKVESIDLGAKTACVRYQNGEVEADLNLPQVAREGHMLLV